MDTTASRDGALHARLAQDEPIVAERERLAADLHDTAGQAFVAVGLLARALAEMCAADPERLALAERIAGIADAGRAEIDDAIRGLTFAPAIRRGLVPAIWGLARDVAADSGIEVEVDARGPLSRMDEAVERALFRVAHQAMANAWRHARCRTLRVDLDFDLRSVCLRVVDDGVGINLAEFEPGIGLAGMRRCVAEVGGTVTVMPARDGGTVVEARTPRNL